jgi:hypothetical protein
LIARRIQEVQRDCPLCDAQWKPFRQQYIVSPVDNKSRTLFKTGPIEHRIRRNKHRERDSVGGNPPPHMPRGIGPDELVFFEDEENPI